MSNPRMLATALEYARRGWPVVPLHSPAPGGCSCGKSACSSPAKHPRTAHGLKDATTDEATIRRWFFKWPDANIGLTTGGGRFVALDIDPRHGGDDSLEALQAEHGELPRTVTASTGGGGRHFLFVDPGGLRNRANIRPGIDLRADGGYIVAAPSVHVSGGGYQWLEGCGPDELQPAELPAWLLELLTEQPTAPTSTDQAATPVSTIRGNGTARLLSDATAYIDRAGGVSEGGRNDAAFRLAGQLRAFRTDGGETLAEAELLQLLQRWNVKNAPPLGTEELAQCLRSSGVNGKPRPVHEVRTERGTSAGPARHVEPMRRIAPWRPFPVELLPPVLRRFVSETAAALGCDPAFVALPMLTTVAAAIGTSRVIELKGNWAEPAILWTAVVARSGSLKSPALDAAVEPLRRAQTAALQQHQEALRAFEREAAEYEKDLSDWKKSKGGEPPAKPEAPACRRFIVADTTIEALGPILERNPRGVLSCRDELAGWLRGFNQYKGGKGSDLASWLELWRAGPLLIDRKSGERRTIHIPRAAVSVSGTVQPGVLAEALSGEFHESGFSARLLLTCPPVHMKVWSDQSPDRATVAAYGALVEALLALEPEPGENGPEPWRLTLAPDAGEQWGRWYDRHAKRIHEAESDKEAALLAKTEAVAARLALLLALADDPAALEVSADALKRGCAVADWFTYEGLRVAGLLAEPAARRELRQVAAWIRERGGQTTARELARGMRAFRAPGAAEAVLEQLVAANLGAWYHPAPGEGGGRPRKVFRLSEGADETPEDDLPVVTKPPVAIASTGVSVPSSVSAFQRTEWAADPPPVGGGLEEPDLSNVPAGEWVEVP